MDAILHTVVDAAVTFPIIVVLGLIALTITYPIPMLIATILLEVWLTRRSKTLRRLQDWYLWFPLQRSFHRLYVPTRRRIARGLMCRVKKSVVAGIIDDALRNAIDTRHITYHDYRELCVKIGQALEITDLIPRGKRHQEAVRRAVEKNCKDMRESLAKVGRTTPEKPKPTLVYLSKRKSAA